jgi:CxxC motif-containing protein (DUF1111 family)
MRRTATLIRFAAFFLLVAATGACHGEVDYLLVEKLGGDTTAFTSNRNAFSQSARNLSIQEHRDFEVGDSFFNQNWVTAPASTTARDGLGPTFNATACSSCHTLDGRARPPRNPVDPTRGLLFRFSIPGEDEHGGPLPDPVYGGQLQDRAILGVLREGSFVLRYDTIVGQYADGTEYTLIDPVYTFENLEYGEYGPLSPDIMISPRIAPAVFGMGLLEAIPEESILANADSDDEDGDGISGRPNMVWDVRAGETRLGRFGWKANVPTIEQQVAGAFIGDIGITSSLFPDENCPSVQETCAAAHSGGTPEVSDDILARIVFYNSTLAVPAMRGVDVAEDRLDPAVRDGAKVFLQAGCQACHIPRHETGEHEIAALSNQMIFPYTDLLLHDMGEGLADNRPDFEASGSEWRTPPLWGLGLVEVVNHHTRFLHDGRARSIEDAILWHGGEGTAAREAFRNMTAEERSLLLKFLKSL